MSTTRPRTGPKAKKVLKNKVKGKVVFVIFAHWGILTIMCDIMQEQIYERFPPHINITELVIHGSQIIIPTEHARVYAD